MTKGIFFRDFPCPLLPEAVATSHAIDHKRTRPINDQPWLCPWPPIQPIIHDVEPIDDLIRWRHLDLDAVLAKDHLGCPLLLHGLVGNARVTHVAPRRTRKLLRTKLFDKLNELP